MTRSKVRGMGAGWAALFLLMAGCAHPRPPETMAAPAALPDPCGGPGAATAGWTEVDTGPFRFSAPREYRRRDVQGIDSYVGRWSASRGRSLDFDWGRYSWAMEDAGERLRDYRECPTRIGGHPATLGIGYDAGDGQVVEGGRGRGYVVAAAWRDITPGTHLSFIATAADASDVPALLAIVRSIRFDPPL